MASPSSSVMGSASSSSMTEKVVIRLRVAWISTVSRRESSEYCSTHLFIYPLGSVMGSSVLRGSFLFSKGPKTVLDAFLHVSDVAEVCG